MGQGDEQRSVRPRPIVAARGESPASHRGRRGAPLTRRDDRAYREYVRKEQRSQRGCIAGRMPPEFHHGLLATTQRKKGRKPGVTDAIKSTNCVRDPGFRTI